MQDATLGGIPGAADVRSRLVTQSVRQHQGTFAFHSKHAAAVMQLYDRGDRVEFGGVIDGEHGYLPVILTHVSLEAGFVFFSGSGEPSREPVLPGARAPHETLGPSRATVGEGGRGSVLVVDDEEAERFFLAAVLVREGYATEVASDGDEALSRFRHQPADVVVTDLQMRNVHGFEVISVVRDASPRPGIIAVSGTGVPQLESARDMGADAVLTKPVSPWRLLDAVGRSLEARREWAARGAAGA